MKLIRRSIYVILPIAFLAACGNLLKETTGNTTPAIHATDMHQTAVSAAFTMLAQTLTAIPTSTAIPTATLPPPTPTRTRLLFRALDGLRVAYIIDGNLYVQDSGKQAIQLTETGQDSKPMFTDDGQKILFYRASESTKKQIYSINSDGTGERPLITSDLLLTRDLGYDEITELTSPVIVPGTHHILFGTQQLNSLKLSNTPSMPNNDLLLADMDTGTIKRLLAIGQGGNFLVSPDGELVAVQAPDRIKVITTQGQIVYQTPFTYPEEDAYTTAIPMTWTQDSRELIVVPPIPTSEIPGNRGFPLLRTIWRYSPAENSKVEIRLDSPPVGEWFRISPDGNWVVYSYQLVSPTSVIWDPGKPVGIYLGNLHDGTSKLLYTPQKGAGEAPYFIHDWFPDSTRFILEDYDMQLYIGNFQGEITPLYRGGYFSWIDNRRYFYGGDALGEIGKEKKFRVVEYPAGFVLFQSDLTFVFLEH